MTFSEPTRGETIALSEHVLLVWKSNGDYAEHWWLKTIDFHKGYWAEARLPDTMVKALKVLYGEKGP